MALLAWVVVRWLLYCQQCRGGEAFVAGPDDDMDWVFEYSSFSNPVVVESIQTTGAFLGGRPRYEVRRRDVGTESGGAYGGTWGGPSFVLTHTPPEDDAVRFLSGDIRKAVATALEAAGGKNVMVAGADGSVGRGQLFVTFDMLVVFSPLKAGLRTLSEASRDPGMPGC